MRKGAVPAMVCGLTLAFACLGATSLDYFTGVEYIPLKIVGVFAGLCAMASLLIYQKVKSPKKEKQNDADYPPPLEGFRAFSPWIILTLLAALVSTPQIVDWFHQLFRTQTVTIFADQTIDLDIFSQIYTWIFIAVILSLLTLHPTSEQLKKATGTWLRRFVGPFLAYSLYFCIAFVMAYSSMEIAGGHLIASTSYGQQNMNVILGSTLAAAFGAGYIFVAASLGLFGAIVGGSETSSNVLFLNIQKTAAKDVGLDPTRPEFMTVYGSHAVAGGIASAVTPAKINNAIVTIDESHKTESVILRKHLVIALVLTIATGILTGVLVHLGI